MILNKIKLKYIVSAIVVISFFILPKTGYGPNSGLIGHVMFPLCHGNIFHLSGNIMCLLLMQGRLFLLPSLLINFVCSYLPAVSFYGPIKMTLGMSGVLFGIIGVKYGMYSTFKEMCKKCLPFALAMALIPHINWCIHIYCLFFGYFYGLWKRNRNL